MNVLWVSMAVTLEVAVSIRQAPSSVCVTLSLVSSWEVTKECVLVRNLCFAVHTHPLESAALSLSSLSPPSLPHFLHSLSSLLLSHSSLPAPLPLLPPCSFHTSPSHLSTHKPLNQMSMSVHKTLITASNCVATLWGHSHAAVKLDMSWM